MQERIRNYFRTCQLVTPAELVAVLGVSRSTVTRHIRPLIAQGVVARLGQGKNIQYLYTKPVSELQQPIVLRKINAQAEVEEIGHLWLTYSGSVLEKLDGSIIEYDGLPWYMYDLMPKGFLGRRIAKRVCRRIKAPVQPDRWTDADLLRFLTKFRLDITGDLYLSAGEYQPKARKQENTSLEMVLEKYGDFAQKTGVSVNGQSTAGGEQAKFTSTRCENNVYKSCLVKYSPSIDSNNPTVVRIRDLLVCEHLALEVLRDYNGHASETELLDDGTRLYLEVSRFDRVAHNNLQGRIGMVSLESVLAEHCGDYAANWVDASILLQQEGLVSNHDFKLMHTWQAFSSFIANSDAHNGNISMFFDELQVQGITPAYDMLPMMYMPIAGEVSMPAPKVNKPKRIDAESWKIGCQLGVQFWQRVAVDDRVSDSFKGVARHWLTYIKDYE